MIYIYSIKLEKGKYYIGKTTNPAFRLQSHFDSNGSKWTQIYKPLKVIEVRPNCNHYDEDKITIEYMDRYGINNVRGGSFVTMKLEKSIIETLKKMSNGRNDKCFICGKKGHFAKNCYKNKYWETDIYEEYEVWSCSYCGKEFDSYKGVSFHENVHCKKKKFSYYQTDKKPVQCYRCGRNGHYSSECYASKHVEGYYL